MAKLTLSDVSNLTGAESAAIATINANWDAIIAALENTLSRDGTSPNQMAADIDLNSNDILNGGSAAFSSVTIGGVAITPTGVSSATAVLTALKTVDGAGSGLDADLLDGQEGSYYLDMDNMVEGTDTKIMTAAERTRLGIATVYVSNRTALKALDTSSNLYAAFDGNVWKWDNSDLSTEVSADTEEAVYASSGDGSSGAWVRLYDGALKAQWFGAVGDGSTDDTDALQAGFDFVSTLGGSLHIPATGSKYRLTSNGIILTNGTKPFDVFGDGKGTIIERASTSIGSVISIHDADDWTLRDFAIEGGSASYSTNANHGIVWYNCSDVVVRNIHVTDYKNFAAIGYVETPVSPPTYKRNFILDSTAYGNGTDTSGGFVLVDLGNSAIRGVTVDNLGTGGSPGYGAQLKNGCQNCSLEGIISIDCVIGAQIGNNNPGSVTATHNRANGITSIGCGTGLALAYQNNTTASNIVIDMQSSGEQAIDLTGDTAGCVVSGGVRVDNIASGKFAARFRSGTSDNTVVLDMVTKGAAPYVQFDSGSSDNTVYLNGVEGGVSSTTSQALVSDLSSGSSNVFETPLLPSSQYLTISSGAVTLAHNRIRHVQLDTEGAASTDDLDTISGGSSWQVITLSQTSGFRDVTIKHGTGNIYLNSASDYAFTNGNQNVTLVYLAGSSAWVEAGRGSVS